MATVPASKLRCYLMGAESLLIHCGEALLGRGHEILGVITAAEPIARWAAERGLPVVPPGPDLAARLPEDAPFDCFFSITNLSVVPDALLARARLGAINFHDGPLPRYAGLYATAWAIANGEAEHGISWHLMHGGVDEGDLLLQRRVAIAPGETSYSLNTKCYEAAIESFPELVDRLAEGRAERTPQDLSQRSYFARHQRPEAGGALRWDRPAGALAALVRALDFGPVENPLGTAKLLLPDGRLVTVTRAEPVTAAGAPGQILSAEEGALVVGCAEGALRITGLATLAGEPLPIAELVAGSGLSAGGALPRLEPTTADRWSAVYGERCKHERFWGKRLGALAPLELPGADHGAASQAGHAPAWQRLTRPLGARARAAGADADPVVGALCAYLGRIADRDAFTVAYRDPALASSVAGAAPLFADHVPLSIEVRPALPFGETAGAIAAELAEVRKRGPFARDLLARRPALRAVGSLGPVAIQVDGDGDSERVTAPSGADLVVSLAADGTEIRWTFDAAVHRAARVEELARRFELFLEGLEAAPARPLAEQPLLAEDERRRLLCEWNATDREIPPRCIHELFEEQVRRTPDAPALVSGEETLTYAALDARANRLGHLLRGEGVGPDVRVGLCVERSTDMVVAMLGILKAGGSYVPLDPGYPKDRIALMLEDAGAPVLVTQAALVEPLGLRAPSIVRLDLEAAKLASMPDGPVSSGAQPHHLAYTLYTSGSTGKPKGVMVEHRNVVNFFLGMDERIGPEPGVWLAVTSLSFDISVLELLWTLCRGFKVVLHTDRADGVARPGAAGGSARAPQVERAARPVEMSLMFFASGDGASESAQDKYHLLLEAAKFGDRNGFVAVWTPERHFHAFGGLYPNPAVASAALATITERIQLRAGSVVSPLHHPIRIAEEWALVDNLSKGRVGISFASGWQPVDFVLRPDGFADRKAIMLRDIETVRRLWRGEALTLTSPLGKEVEVRTLPRPVQKELPVWVTAAGNPETFVEAAKLGANVLTHLLGQSLDEVASKVALYRKTWQEAGHPGRGTVTLMLHTFVGSDEAAVRETVRQPMKDYLRSAVNLIKAAAWSFPTFKQKADATGRTPAEIFESEALSEAELDALLEHAFERYYTTSGLFGTPEACSALVGRIAAIDVDEVACLLDYGVPSAEVLAHLPQLLEVKERAARPAAPALPATPREASRELTLEEQIRRHAVTHLQCTPSQMSLILMTDEARAALGSLRKIFLGGEAFPTALAAQLRAATPAQIVNMYGPTETTIWSSTQPVRGDEAAISIGRPIANNTFYILDRHRQPVPVGAVGELYIGGDGVARGYHARPELTAERFVPDPFRARPGARMYRTGDLARWNADGTVDFLGRADFQVKIRGYRIELGEIEAQLRRAPGVREAVVIAREDAPGDKRLVGYLTAQAGQTVQQEGLRAALLAELPDYMVPSAFVLLPALPLTPNGKVDRKALPAPDHKQAPKRAVGATPASELERQIAAVWQEALGVGEVGLDDNFFDLGGHSLLAVQVHRSLRAVTGRPLALTDLFRFPTIRALAQHLGAETTDTTIKDASLGRADQRRAAMAKRQRLRGGGA